MRTGHYSPVAWQLPAIEGVVFTTEKGDKAFLAALKRERPAMHADFAHAPARRRTVPDRIAPPLPTNGTCPTCGTRLAFGCAHHPATASSSAAVGGQNAEGVAA
jgi:hypothetical protein